MISGFFTFLLIVIISFFPVVIWAYIFTYIDESHLSKQQLLSGVFAGAISVAPILFMQDLLDFLGIQGINIFSLFSSKISLYSWIPSFLSLFLFLSGFLFASFITQLILRKRVDFTENYKGSILVFLGGIIGIISIYFLGSFFPFLTKDIGTLVHIDGIILNSLILVIGYYFVIALLEEGSKYFQFLSGSVSEISLRRGVLYAIFIALGFSFIENILYTFFLYSHQGFSSELLKLYFFRGVFSIILHILCTVILAYSSMKAFVLPSQKKLSIFLIGFLVSIFFHAFFDIAITLGFSLVLIIYFIGGYLYVSSLFYKDEN